MHPQPDPPTEAPVPLESRVRFSLRGMFIGMGFAAAALAALAPWFRQWNEAEQRHFVVFWINAAFGAAAATAFSCVMRVRLERRAGRAYYRLPTCVSTFGFCVGSGRVLPFIMLTASFSLQPSTGGVGPLAQWAVFDGFATFMGAIIASHSLSACWHAGLEICENGLITNGVLVPWKFILSYRWASSDPRSLLIQCRHSITSVGANLADKPAIERYLNMRLTPSSQRQA